MHPHVTFVTLVCNYFCRPLTLGAWQGTGFYASVGSRLGPWRLAPTRGAEFAGGIAQRYTVLLLEISQEACLPFSRRYSGTDAMGPFWGVLAPLVR